MHLTTEKPFAAKEYMQEVEMSEAFEFAPEEYLQLRREYLQLEELYRKHRYTIINKRLPLFVLNVNSLVELALRNKSIASSLSVPIEPSPPMADTATDAKNNEELIPLTTSPPPISTEDIFVTPVNERTIKLKSTYTVGEGELLWSIAKRPDVYSDPLLWPLIYQANRDQIKDPRIIYTGQTLSIPRNISESEREEARNLAKKSDFFSLE